MKLNFKEWTIVHTALVELADRQRSEMNWYEEGDDKRVDYAKKLRDTMNVIEQLEVTPV